MEDYDEYFKHSKLLTELYAMPKELKALQNNTMKENTSSMMDEEKRQAVISKKQNGNNNKKKWMKRI